MASHSINLNDDDMWDDSVLVDSWNEALDEYKVRYPKNGRRNLILTRLAR